MKQSNLTFPCHFVVLDQKWEVLLKGYVNADGSVMLTFRYSAPNDGQVSESYSGFDVILNMILPLIRSGTLPTIQFGDEEKIKEFLT